MVKSTQIIKSKSRDIPKQTIIYNPGSTLNEREQRNIQYFREMTATELVGYFDSDFWGSILLQVSDCDSTVRHALLALSSMHEGLQVGGDIIPGNSRNNSHRRFAIHHYNLAVTQTLQLLPKQDEQSLTATLVCGLLFTFVELIQCNYVTAIHHLVHALKVLSRIPNSLQRVGDELRKLYSRIMLQSLFLGAPHFHIRLMLKLTTPKPMQPFESISDARDALDKLYLDSYPFLCSVSLDFIHGIVSPEKLPPTHTHPALAALLSKWHNLFQSFLSGHHRKLTPKDNTGVILLRIHYLCLKIILGTALDATDAAVDAFTESFTQINSLASDLLNSSVPLPSFSFDLGLIGPLFFVATKSQSTNTRWSAIKLLNDPRIPSIEGIWGRKMTARMAQRIVEVNEEMAVGEESYRDPEDVNYAYAKESAERAARPGIPGQLFTKSAVTIRDVWFDKPLGDDRALKISVGASKAVGGVVRDEWVTW